VLAFVADGFGSGVGLVHAASFIVLNTGCRGS